MISRCILALIAISIQLSVFASGKPQSFSSAKKKLTKLYSDNQRSFYCGCDYRSITKQSGKGKKLSPVWATCGFSPRKQIRRASRIEWEHIMPAHHFGQHLACWREGGRKGCKKNRKYKSMEGDMHNLVPAIGEVNGDRSDFKFAILPGETRVYGRCDAEVDFKARRFEPTESVRGNIARAYFYMADVHRVRLSKQQRRLFSAWDKQDPVDEWERERNRRIAKIQGTLNPYIEKN